ncbi:hypothetical protein Mapa_006894 [Marchantia paleacea]|nr:hypothetical protein Mapa_006894 [Marchantia paleacea]
MNPSRGNRSYNFTYTATHASSGSPTHARATGLLQPSSPGPASTVAPPLSGRPPGPGQYYDTKPQDFNPQPNQLGAKLNARTIYGEENAKSL